jgi:prevent-host-death family protein
MSRSYSIAQARNQLTRLVHRAERGAAVELTRHGKPVAVIVAKHVYEELTSQRPSLWAALEQFRRDADFDALAAGPDPFEGLRDRSPGRKVRV